MRGPGGTMAVCTTPSTSPTWSGTPRWCGWGRSPPASPPGCWPRSSTSTPAAASRTASRCAWSRRRRPPASCAPAARSSSRRPATPGSGWRSWPSARGTAACSSARTRSARTSATCSRPTARRSSCARPRSTRTTRTPTTASPTGSSGRSTARGSPTSTRTRRTRSRTTLGTGPEIWEQTEGRITHFVAGIGTGGTISGVGRYLKEVSDGRVQVIGADPEGSVYSGGTGRPYLVEGVGEDFWPTTYDKDICDQIIAVSDTDSFAMTGGWPARRALLVGGSCGMARCAALRVAAELPRQAATPSSSCCCPTAVAATSARCSTTRGWPATASCRRRRGRPSATCCARKDGTIPALVHAHPNETVRRRRSTTCASSASRRCPSCAPSRRSMAAEVAGAVVRAGPARRAVHRPGAALGPPRAAHVAAAAHARGNEALDTAMSALRGRGRRAGARRRQARGHGDAAPTCWRSSAR